MSESSWAPSPISASPSDSDDLTEDLDLGFDGAEALLRAWRRGMRPDPDLTVSEWADQHRKLSSRASAEPGQYRTARTPYLREIMDALSPRHPAQRISFMKATQVALDLPQPSAFDHPGGGRLCRRTGQPTGSGRRRFCGAGRPR